MNSVDGLTRRILAIFLLIRKISSTLMSSRTLSITQTFSCLKPFRITVADNGHVHVASGYKALHALIVFLHALIYLSGAYITHL